MSLPVTSSRMSSIVSRSILNFNRSVSSVSSSSGLSTSTSGSRRSISTIASITYSNSIISIRLSNRSIVTNSIIHCHRSFSSSAASTSPDGAFDVFQKLKDPPGSNPDDNTNNSKRKPSDKVLKLADQIMSLTLIEAADLCDLCQDRLTPGPEGSGGLPGRMPFPHPGGMFGSGMMGGMGMGVPQMGMMPQPMAGAPVAAAPAAPAADSESDADDKPAAEAAAKKEEKPKEETGPVNLKLVSFDEKKKIAVIKEVRALTSLGLKESKDLVESVPKILQKGVPRADAAAIIEKFKSAMAVVEFA